MNPANPTPAAKKRFQSVNPYTLEVAGEYPLETFGQIRQRVTLAQQTTQSWKKVSVTQRIRWLREGLAYFETHRSEIARDITAQMGKPLRQSENEINGFFERFEYLIGIAAEVLAPDILPPKPGFLRRIEHCPLGVILIIAPWNYPLLTAVNGVATALLAGNTVLLKHSAKTAAIGDHFAKAFGRLGPHENVLQSFFAEHADIERAISECDINHVVFTGSVAGGRRVQQSAAHRFIDCNLELGGKDAAYVAADADVAAAAADLVDGAMYNAGQSCCGVERVYVHRNVYAAFVEQCRVLAEAYVLGDPMDAKTTMGPLASATAAHAMTQQIEAAVKSGAQVLTGGKVRHIGSSVFFEPTLLVHADNAMAVVREENFGPILPIVQVDDDEQALGWVNDSPYGLTSAIYTQDVDSANRFAAEADTGTVFMNRCDYLDPALPWTGIRDSGRGTSLSKYGFYSLTRRKAIHFRLPK
jgi:acyl-CoA reductase-like NAD-dependent aldehyde dehydrogenase